jgi:type VI secretion system secreted protein VgrG
MGEYTQDHRLIAVYTTLGPDELLLQGFRGTEGISRLFKFDLVMHSENRSISFDSVVGKTATIKVVLQDGQERFINGIVASFSQGGATSTFASYTATLVPWFWMLTRTNDCRIFQTMTVPDIIQKLFQEHGFSDFKNKLHGSYTSREYCVQYRETTFNFISRLMEEEGIFYFFEHEQDKHTLVMADSPGEFKPCPNQSTARYQSGGNVGKTEDIVIEWSIGQEVRPGKYTVDDFNFEKPLMDLTADVDGKDPRKFEIYDYPGEYETRDQGEKLAGIRMEEEQTPQIVISGSSTCRAFTSGYRFDLNDHYRRDLNKAYTLMSVYHSCDAGTNYRSSDGGRTSEFAYVNQFQCVPHPLPFRPPRTAPIPVIHGTQTALVVGPPGEEIYVDKYGRVKVQFHWDREGKYDDKSSCWIRVSQNWAGKRWGAMFIPRVGQEVIVDFIEGDPDRPIITGRVYNGASMPPYELPAEKTKSSIKSYSYKGGGGFNELRFEDKKGSEQIFIQAQKDQDVRVKNVLKEFVGNDTHLIVKHDQLNSVSGDKHQHVSGDHNEKVDGTVSLNAGADIQEKVRSRYALDAGTEVHIKAGTNVVIESGVTLTVKVGANFININPGGIFISGKIVNINSGGAAGQGAGSSPQPPKDPLEADTAEAGAQAELPPPKQPPKPATFSPGAVVIKQAAQDGLPFAEMP